MINLDLEKQINEQIEQTVKNYLSSDDLASKIKEQVDSAVGAIIERVAGRVYADVVNQGQISDFVKSIVQLEAEQAIKTESLNIVRLELSKTPVREIVETQVRREANLRFETLDFPDSSVKPSVIDWKKGSVSGSAIKGGLIEEFSSTGIDDKANSVQLTILPDHVVVENQFTAMNITAADTLTAKNLCLTGTLEIGTEILDHGPFSQLCQMHAQMVVDDAIAPLKTLLRDNQPVITENSLHPSVTQSNIRKLGNLSELVVLGDGSIGDTLFVGSNGKVGINTDEPRGALTVRDEDAEFTLTRTNRRTMFMGSTRDSDLEIGVNSQSQIKIKEQQVDFSTPIKVMGIKFSVGIAVPDREGEPNEIVMISTARDGQPMFYICKGGNKWQSLK